jgi:hypothetical protein
VSQRDPAKHCSPGGVGYAKVAQSAGLALLAPAP